MDPLSIATGVASLVLSTTKVVKQCNDFRSKYKIASITLPAIATECHTICVALSQIEALFDRDPNGTSARLNSKAHLRLVFENALTGCAIVVSIIDDEVEKLMKSAQDDVSGQPSRMARVKYVWDEDTMKELLQQARGQQTAIQTLLAALQSESLYQVQGLLQAQGNVLTRIAQRAFSLRESRSPSNTRTRSGPDTTDSASISNFTVTSSTEFSFDNEIVNATAYRNAYQNYNRAIKEKKVPARNEKVSSSSTATDLIELGDDETLKTPAISGLTISDTSVFSLGSATDLHSLFERQSKPDESQEDAEPPADNESDAATLAEKEKKHKATVAMIRAQVLAERKLTTPDKAAGPRISEVPTLLHVAAYGDRLDLAKKYLESNLDPNILHGPWSPLNIAIQSENIPMVKLLLAHGADVEFVGSEKRYPLVNACQMGNGQIINLLLEHGADPNTVTEAGVTSLIAATRHDNPTIVEPLLVKGALPDTQANTDGFTALHMAAGDNQEKMMKLLMRYGASPEVTCDKFGSALHIAATKGHLEATKLLLKAGVEVDAVGGEDSQTALHQSVRNSHKEVTRLLLQFRANPDARDAKDIPVWHRAIQAERADILEMLLWKTRPALILENTYTKIKVTGLQMAALRGNPSIVAVLLKMGADPTNKGAMGHHPLALAGNEETRKLLQNAADAWISRLQKTAE